MNLLKFLGKLFIYRIHYHWLNRMIFNDVCFFRTIRDLMILISGHSIDASVKLNLIPRGPPHIQVEVWSTFFYFEEISRNQPVWNYLWRKDSSYEVYFNFDRRDFEHFLARIHVRNPPFLLAINCRQISSNLSTSRNVPLEDKFIRIKLWLK